MKSKCKSGLTDLKTPHLESTDRNTLPCWECTNCETLVAASASTVPFSHLCPNSWHTELPCTAVRYLTLNRHVLCLMTGCCCSKSEQKCEECMCAPPQQNGDAPQMGHVFHLHSWNGRNSKASAMMPSFSPSPSCSMQFTFNQLFPFFFWRGCYLHGSCSTFPSLLLI